jgi:hypothetical protein
MKPGSTKAGLLLGAAAIATLTLVSWDFKQPARQEANHFVNDTIPVKKADRDKKVRDLDEALEELDNINIDVQIGKAMEEASQALKQLDQQKLRLDVEKAMKDVDFEKIKVDLDKAMKSIDLSKINVEIENALKGVDMEKIQAEVKQSLAQIDWKEMNEDLKKAQNINLDALKVDLEKVSVELKNIEPEIKKSLEGAKVEIEKAKTEIREYKTFVDDLDKQGLINKKEDYNIKHKDGELIINGKKATSSITEKHSRFLEKHKDFTIKKEGDNFNIDKD